MPWRGAALGLASLGLAACAAPPVTLYTLGQTARPGSMSPLAPPSTVIAIARITLPDYMDTQDILVRQGNVLRSSHDGRWASRLSLGVTELVAERLAQLRPDALVTDQPQTTTPSYRIVINISRLDLGREAQSVAGTATLDADWITVPHNTDLPSLRDRVHIAVIGPLGTDQDIVAVTTELLIRLAAAIDVKRLH